MASVMVMVMTFIASCADAPPRHVVLIVVDTLRRDHLSPYGGELRTPRIQALADRGLVFRNLQASFHQTTMSMGALFTGRLPSIESEDPDKTLPWTGRTWCGLSRFAQQESGPGCIPTGIETLPERLQRAGWFTVGIVGNPLLFAPSGFERGFDVWREVELQEADASPAESTSRPSAERVLAELEAVLADPPHERSFLYLHYIDVHQYVQGSRLKENYARAVEAFDADFGRLMDLLRAYGVLEDAVVVLTSDHGESLGERHAVPGRPSHRGDPSFQTVLDIPLIVSPIPDEDPEPMLRSQDLAALIERFAGLAPDRTAGNATDPVLPSELLLTERLFVTYRKGQWKSVFHRTDPRQDALFDLGSDPDETFNGISQWREIAETHRLRVAELTAEISAPAPSGDRQTEADRLRLRALGYLE
jgi:arylsulfatase A-like enzyme